MRQIFARLHRVALPAFFALLLLTACYLPANGQSTRSIGTTGRRIDEINKQAEKFQRDELNREMRGKRLSEEELKERAARKARIEEDLEGLQTEYNNIVEKLNLRETIGPAFASEAADRIHERASRLRHDLIFHDKPADDNAETLPARPDGGSVSLHKLCTEIHAFLTSPVLDNPAIVDVRESARTRDTLDRIIQISDILRH